MRWIHGDCQAHRRNTRAVPSQVTFVKGVAASAALEAAIGHTPLVPLRRLAQHLGDVEVAAKAEWLNPGGSVKDRAAREMLRHAEETGALRPGKVLLEATSGNTGIALAMLGAARGYPVVVCLPENASPERKRILRAYGTQIVETSPLEGTDGAIRRARELEASDPDRYLYLNQYDNPANWQAHYRTTANEIWQQTEGTVTHFVAGLGTGGTFVGTARRLKELAPGVQCVSFQPDVPLHGIEGLKHLPSSRVPGIYDPELADAELILSTEEAFAATRSLAREEGLFVGISSGAALVAALRVAERLERGRIVTVFPDGGSKYLSESLWYDERS